MFQFRFESENDLLSVLAKGPYHHKRWMLLLQRWEPIISPTFPSSISFWVRVHGLPLHFWNDETLYTIGKALGNVSTRDVREARFRVEVNGLLPLEMKSEVLLPSGDTTEIEFEYIKMEKHCFTCFSLSHEEDDCPLRPADGQPAKNRKLGITQALALERIEASKKSHDDKRGYKPPAQLPVPPYEDRRTITSYANQPEAHNVSRATSPHDHHSSANKGSLEYARRPPSSISHRAETPKHYGSRREAIYHRAYHRRREYQNMSITTPSGSISSRYQRPPYEDNHPGRQVRLASPHRSGSRTSHTPPPVLPRELMDMSRMSTPSVETSRSRERRSVLERVAALDLRDQLFRRSSSSKDSPRVKGRDSLNGTTHQTTPPVLESGQQPPPPPLDKVSDRAPATQCLGGLTTLGIREKTRLATENAIDHAAPTILSFLELVAEKSTTKRKTPRATTNKRIARSPMGLKLKKAVIVRSTNPPRKRICTEKGRSLPWNKAGPSANGAAVGTSNAVNIPSKKVAGTDFRPLPLPLP